MNDDDRATLATLLHREVMLKRAHGALTDAGCVVPIKLDTSIEYAIHTLAERALTAEERLERMTRERDEARAELSMANIEACALATAIQKSEYPDAKNFELRNSVAGVISQINNMYAGIRQQRDEARAQLAATDTDTGSPCDGHRHCCADRRRLADELLRVRAERDNAQLTFESCNRARRLAEEECDALKEKHAPSK